MFDCKGYNYETYIWGQTQLDGVVINNIYCENNLINQNWWVNKNNGTGANGKDVLLLAGKNYNISNISCKRPIERGIYSQASNVLATNIICEDGLASKFVGRQDNIAKNITISNIKSIIKGEPREITLPITLQLQIYWVENFFADNIEIIISENAPVGWNFGNTSIVSFLKIVRNAHLSNLSFNNYSPSYNFGYYLISESCEEAVNIKLNDIYTYNFGNKARGFALISNQNILKINNLQICYSDPTSYGNRSRQLSRQTDYSLSPEIVNSTILLSPGPTDPQNGVYLSNLERCKIESIFTLLSSLSIDDFIDALYNRPVSNVIDTVVYYEKSDNRFNIRFHIPKVTDLTTLANCYDKIEMYFASYDYFIIPIPENIGSNCLDVNIEFNGISYSRIVYYNDQIFTVGTNSPTTNVISTSFGKGLAIGTNGGVNLEFRVVATIKPIRDLDNFNHFVYDGRNNFPTHLFRNSQDSRGILMYDSYERQHFTWNGIEFVNLDGSPYGKRKGTSLERPNNIYGPNYGVLFYDDTLNKPIWWNGSSWLDANGNNPDIITKGDTASRPALISSDSGHMYYDTTLNKPIWWTGSFWVDATGSQV